MLGADSRDERSIIRDREQVQMQRDSVGRAERMLRVAKHLHPREVLAERFTEAGAREEVFVIGFQ